MDGNGLLLHLKEENDKVAVCAGVLSHLKKLPPKLMFTLFSGYKKKKKDKTEHQSSSFKALFPCPAFRLDGCYYVLCRSFSFSLQTDLQASSI